MTDKEKQIKILALSWRDIRSKGMGGAEILTHEMFKGGIKEGMEITHIAPESPELPKEEVIDGVKYLRMGNTLSVILKAMKYYKANRDKFDVVIDQCNTHRFFTPFWVEKEKRVFLIYQLTREIWDINLKKPFSTIGKVLETPMLKLNRKDTAITESESTRQDLINVGFNGDKVHIVPIGLNEAFLSREVQLGEKSTNDFIYVGRYASYKGIDHTVKAYATVHKKYSDSKLRIVGKKNDQYIKDVLEPICRENNITIGDSEDNNVVTCGFVSDEEKQNLMIKSRALIFPSMREGWGMIVSEAGALGTPSITYDAPGMRDAVNFGDAGYMCKPGSIDELTDKMLCCIEKSDEYFEIQKKAYDYSRTFSFEESGNQFAKVIKKFVKDRA